MLACTEARFIQSLLFITYVNVFRGTGARHYTFGHDGCDSCLTQIITHLDEKVSVESLFAEEWNGRIPSIIKALRPDDELYREALYLFTALQKYVLNKSNSWGYGDLNNDAILNIWKMKIVPM